MTSHSHTIHNTQPAICPSLSLSLVAVAGRCRLKKTKKGGSRLALALGSSTVLEHDGVLDKKPHTHTNRGELGAENLVYVQGRPRLERPVGLQLKLKGCLAPHLMAAWRWRFLMNSLFFSCCSSLHLLAGRRFLSYSLCHSLLFSCCSSLMAAWYFL
eukprot:CAMPEP_0118970970 /NCGR_PEP_ID=MMETSP1173-20130426/7739_1 /TAXON_ID=1034831 /ORGANISM="Rhizochromulina marina cf, Strain CCMP1243" /LENGTH=156 /DNA_ID=CAMNT_0006920391 /DNA_START=11 /DNA_END=479 /DNA_ORIENTATION=+